MALPTSVDLLDRARKAIADREGLKRPVSDYRVAKELGITNQTVSKIRNGKTTWGYPTNVKLAGLIGVDPRWLIAVVEVERAQRAQYAPLASLWKDISGKLGVAFLPLILSGFLMPHPAHADVGGAGYAGGSVYYGKTSWRGLLRRLKSLACALAYPTYGVQDACAEQGAF